MSEGWSRAGSPDRQDSRFFPREETWILDRLLLCHTESLLFKSRLRKAEVLKSPHLEREKHFGGLKDPLPSPGLSVDFGQKPPSFDLSPLSVKSERGGGRA